MEPPPTRWLRLRVANRSIDTSSELILASLGKVAAAALEELMASQNYEYQSEFAKTHRAQGRVEGEARGEALAVLAVLDARGVVVTEVQKERILGCTDRAALDRWIRRAVTAVCADDLFDA